VLNHANHHGPDIGKSGDRVLFLHAGKILAAGTPEQIPRHFQETDLIKNASGCAVSGS
jgi:ABC-type multidrug transport system ATPase subunit